MEVVRSFEPKKGYLEEIRKICTEKNIILIFDECTSGFRETYGGIHKKFNVSPDMCMFGKALGNGYAVTAVIGKRNIMEAAQSTFISSTFWTEKIGAAAGLATLNEMKKTESWKILKEKGKKIKKIWKSICDELNVKININGIDPLASFSIDSTNWLDYKTYITQEMLEKKFLSSNVVYMSTKHSENDIIRYSENLYSVFYELKKIIDSGKEVSHFLKSSVCHSGFNRLN